MMTRAAYGPSWWLLLLLLGPQDGRTGAIAGEPVQQPYSVSLATSRPVPVSKPTRTLAATVVLTSARAVAAPTGQPDLSAPLPDAGELRVEELIDAVLARNPTLVQMTAAWQAASARYPQVTSLDDPMAGAIIGPA